jgi:uncharacterized protein YodC (DUF2158 family)
MADQQWNVGDVVQLKSGGPRMTVEEVHEHEIWCKWFNDKKELKGEGFRPELLTGGGYSI